VYYVRTCVTLNFVGDARPAPPENRKKKRGRPRKVKEAEPEALSEKNSRGAPDEADVPEDELEDAQGLDDPVPPAASGDEADPAALENEPEVDVADEGIPIGDFENFPPVPSTPVWLLQHNNFLVS